MTVAVSPPTSLLPEPHDSSSSSAAPISPEPGTRLERVDDSHGKDAVSRREEGEEQVATAITASLSLAWGLGAPTALPQHDADFTSFRAEAQTLQVADQAQEFLQHGLLSPDSSSCTGGETPSASGPADSLHESPRESTTDASLSHYLHDASFIPTTTSSSSSIGNDPNVVPEGRHLPTSSVEHSAETAVGSEAKSAEAGADATHDPHQEQALHDDDEKGEEEIGPNVSPMRFVTPKDFELLKVIGMGSFGKVLQVRHKHSQQILAMKVISKRLLRRKSGYIENVQAERNIMTKVRHPFVVTMHCSFQTKEKLFIVMDFLAGGELFLRIGREGIFLEKTAAFYLAEMILALDHLHTLGILHRDLKPENVLLGSDGHVCLTDFGLAKDLSNEGGFRNEDDDTRVLTVCGTQEYMAPEMVARQGYGRAADYWSLGCIAYEMMSGLPPFQSKKGAKDLFRKIMTERVKMPDGATAAACKLLKGLLNRNAQARLGSARSTMFEVGGVAGLKLEEFFRTIDWEKLERKEIPPPDVLSVQNESDLRHFHGEFTGMALPRSVLEMSREDFQPRRVESQAFRGFSFIQEDFKLPERHEGEVQSYWDSIEEDGESVSDCASSKMDHTEVEPEPAVDNKKRPPRKRKKKKADGKLNDTFSQPSGQDLSEVEETENGEVEASLPLPATDQTNGLAEQPTVSVPEELNQHPIQVGTTENIILPANTEASSNNMTTTKTDDDTTQSKADDKAGAGDTMDSLSTPDAVAASDEASELVDKRLDKDFPPSKQTTTVSDLTHDIANESTAAIISENEGDLATETNDEVTQDVVATPSFQNQVAADEAQHPTMPEPPSKTSEKAKEGWQQITPGSTKKKENSWAGSTSTAAQQYRRGQHEGSSRGWEQRKYAAKAESSWSAAGDYGHRAAVWSYATPEEAYYMQQQATYAGIHNQPYHYNGNPHYLGSQPMPQTPHYASSSTNAGSHPTSWAVNLQQTPLQQNRRRREGYQDIAASQGSWRQPGVQPLQRTLPEGSVSRPAWKPSSSKTTPPSSAPVEAATTDLSSTRPTPTPSTTRSSWNIHAPAFEPAATPSSDWRQHTLVRKTAAPAAPPEPAPVPEPMKWPSLAEDPPLSSGPATTTATAAKLQGAWAARAAKS